MCESCTKANGNTNSFNNRTFTIDNVKRSHQDEEIECTCVPYSDYRYGFQGQEKDDEIKGKGNSLNYKYRMYDARLGRFFAVDKYMKKYPFWTPYAFSGNIVIMDREFEGLEPKKGDPNYGKHIVNCDWKSCKIIMDPKSIQKYPSAYGPDGGKIILENLNWIGVSKNNFEDLAVYMSSLKSENPDLEIETLYLQGHGDNGSFSAHPKAGEEDFHFDMKSDRSKVTSLDKDDFINYFSALELKGGLEEWYGDHPKDRVSFDAIASLESVFENMSDEGTVIMGQCYAGVCSNTIEIYSYLSKLANYR